MRKYRAPTPNLSPQSRERERKALMPTLPAAQQKFYMADSAASPYRTLAP